MLCGKSLLTLLATIFNLNISLIDGAYLEKRPAVALDDLAAIMVTEFPPNLNNSPAVSRTVTAAPPNCTPWTQCILFFQFINVYYWPEASQNTACLSDSQASYDQSIISDIEYPSIYVIIPSIRASDGCNTVGPTFAGLTTSFPPGALSTIGPDSKTYSFNFGDLPCPPADKGWDSSKGSYAPQLAPPDFLFKLDPAFAACTPGYKQGIDPYHTLQSATTASGPGAVGCRHGTCGGEKREVERPHLLPWGPQKTAEPTS